MWNHSGRILSRLVLPLLLASLAAFPAPALVVLSGDWRTLMHDGAGGNITIQVGPSGSCWSTPAMLA